MIPLPPRSSRTDTLFPYPTLFRSLPQVRAGDGNPRQNAAGSAGRKLCLEPWGIEVYTAISAAMLRVEKQRFIDLVVHADCVGGGVALDDGDTGPIEIGSASCGERLCHLVSVPVVALSYNKKPTT